MPCHKPFSYIKKFVPGRQTYVLYAVFCMLLCITPPSFSAEQFGPEASTVSPSIDSGPELAEGSAELLTAEGLTAGGGWAATYGGADNDCADSIQQTTDGGYIVTGRTDSFGAGEEDLWVMKLGPDGAVEWQKTYGGGGFDRAHSIQQTVDGGYVVAGETRSFDGGIGDAWVLKLEPDGIVEWQKACGGHRYERANSIQPTTDGGYIVAGYTNSFIIKGLGSDLWVLKLKLDGSVETSCDFIRNTSTSEKDSDATLKTTNVSPRASDATPQDSSATIQATNVSANILCPSSSVEQ